MNEKINGEYLVTEITVMQHETSGDYILPDSYPDVKNILSCSARICEINKYSGAGEYEISGSIVYNIMFCGATGDDSIFSVSFNDNFKNSAKYKYPSNISSGMQTKIKDVFCRTANPRRFSLKTCFETLLYENVNKPSYPEIVCQNAENTCMQYKFGESDVFRCQSVMLDEHSFGDNIEIDMKLPEIEELVHSDAALYVRDDRILELDSKTPKFSGIFALSAVYKDKDGMYHSINRDLPFGITLAEQESSMIGEIDADTVIIPSVNLAAININVGKNQYEENRIIELDADYDIDLLIMTKEKIMYVTDAYSTVYASECKYENENVLVPKGRIKNNFTYSNSKEKNSLGLDAESSVFCDSAKISDIYTEKSGDNLALSGKICEKLVSASDGKNMREKDASFTFSHKTPCKLGDNISLVGNAVLSDNRIRCDFDKIYVDLELYLDYVLSAREKANVCKSVYLTEAKNDCRSGIFSVYYPSPDETAWDIAKKMKTTIDKINMLNPNANLEAGICEPIVIE